MDIKNISLGAINTLKANLGLADSEIEESAINRYSKCLDCELISDNKTRCDSNKLFPITAKSIIN